MQDFLKLDSIKQIDDLPDALFDMLPVGVYVCDADGRIVRFNFRAAEIWGRDPIIGDIAERFCGSYRMYQLNGSPLPHSECPMADVLRTGRSVQDEEVVIERPDGTRRVALVNINALKDSDGQIVGAVNCFQDITERKQIEEEQRRVREQVETLTDRLAHESDRLRESERQSRVLMDALPAAVYQTDASGRITYYNESAAAFWGCRPELGESEFCGSWKLYWPDGSPMRHDECPMAIALKTGRPVRESEAIAERPDGKRIPFVPYPTPLHDASGRLIGAINMLVDSTERKQAEEATQQLAAIVEYSDDAIMSTDLDGNITSWNKGAERLYGYAADEIIGKPVTVFIPPERQDEEIGILSRIRSGEHVEHYETIRCRKDDTRVDVSLTVSPIMDAKGKIVGASKIARNITEKKRAEETKELLLHEIKHRVKNTLATVQSIASQTFRRAPAAERDAFLARLQGLGRTYDLLSSHDWGRAPVRAIVQRAITPFQEKHQDRISISGPDASLDSGKSLLLSLVLHELGTNATKYGALSDQGGQVCVDWELIDGSQTPALTLRWRERGGPPVKRPRRKGFGSRLILHATKHELGGGANLDFRPQGVVCTLSMGL